MDKWKRYTGEEILYNALDENGVVSNESMLEDAMKLGISTSSNGECVLLKFYWTDGFGWYFKDGKITSAAVGVRPKSEYLGMLKA